MTFLILFLSSPFGSSHFISFFVVTSDEILYLGDNFSREMKNNLLLKRGIKGTRTLDYDVHDDCREEGSPNGRRHVSSFLVSLHLSLLWSRKVIETSYAVARLPRRSHFQRMMKNPHNMISINEFDYTF
jgi:hypothetical protein